MVISRKHEKNIEKVIEKGGKTSNEDLQNDWVVITLRLTKELLNSIEKCKSKRIGLTRNAWILEAIQEKLKSDEYR